MLATTKIKPRVICNFGLEVQTNCFLKKESMNVSVITTVKKYLAHTICKTGISELRYFAIPSMIGKMHQASKL